MPPRRENGQSGLVAKYLAPVATSPGSTPGGVRGLNCIGILNALSDGIGQRGTDILNWIRAGTGAAIRSARPSNFSVSQGHCFGPPAGPGGVDAAQMAALAKRHGDLAAKHRASDLGWFKAQVQNKGPWDYKQRNPELQDYGNYHYGYVGTRQGIPEGILRMGGGYAQLRACTSKPSFVTSLFDDPNDQRQIARGANDARNGCY